MEVWTDPRLLLLGPGTSERSQLAMEFQVLLDVRDSRHVLVQDRLYILEARLPNLLRDEDRVGPVILSHALLQRRHGRGVGDA